jgi:hypothetical protein
VGRRETRQRLAYLLEQLEAIDADPTLVRDPDHDKPISIALYEELLEGGWEGDRPTLAELDAWMEAELREALRELDELDDE